MSDLKIGGATVNQTPLDWEGNFLNIKEAIQEAKLQRVELLCFPELSITGYGSEDLFLSNWYLKKALECVQMVLPLTEGMTVCIGTPLKVEGQLYNTMAIIEEGELCSFVVKQTLAIDGLHYEYRWFKGWEPGKIVTIEIFGQEIPVGDIIYEKKGIKYGFEICEDAWRGTHRPGYRLRERGVSLILNPSASHFVMGKSLVREELVEESAELLQVTYFYINLLGNEAGRAVFDGEMLMASAGKLRLKNTLLSFQNFQLKTFFLHNQPKPVKSVHEKNKEFIKASSLALFDYLRKSKTKGFVLSLNGDVNSAAVAVLVAEMVRRGIEALGVEEFLNKLNVSFKPVTADPLREITGQLLFTVYQGTTGSPGEPLESARQLAESIGATFYNWQVSEEIDSYTKKIQEVLGTILTGQHDHLALKNLQASAKSPMLGMLADIKQAILLSTSDRNELDLGYSNLDGDTSGSLAPIASVDKPFISEWLKWAQSSLGYNGLSLVNSLKPAETDEDEPILYTIILEIERLAIQDKRSPADIYLILQEELTLPSKHLKHCIRIFFKLWVANQWKREKLAPSFHLDEFNVDPKTWCRFPILSGGFEAELRELETLEE